MATPVKTKPKSKEDGIDNETFGMRVKRLRLAAGMASPSDLARKLWGEHTDGRGFTIANNRDTIWRYETDRSVPSRKNLGLLAAALGVTEAELDPVRAANEQARRVDVLEVRALTDGKYRLVVDLDVPDSVALDIFAQIHAWLRTSPTSHVRVVKALPKELPKILGPKAPKVAPKALPKKAAKKAAPKKPARKK